MTIFELVKIALDELYQEALETYGENTDATIKARMSYLTKSYFNLTDVDREPVDYKDPATRFAYTYKYVACHGDYLVQVLTMIRDKSGGEPIFDTESIRVSCIGGGPGSDIIAVLKYLDENQDIEPVSKVTCYLLDREQAWADTWTELDESLKSPITLNANFQPLDVTSPDSWQSQKKFLQADLFTMSYFASEVHSLDGEGIVTAFWGQLFASAKSGALFVYTDNKSEAFDEHFDSLCAKAGLKTLISGGSDKFWPRFSEQAKELAIYNEKFNHNPKVQAKLSYRVLRKE